MDGSVGGLPSREEAAEHRDGSASASVGPESEVSEESNYEESDGTDMDDDFEGTINIAYGQNHANCVPQ